MRGEGIQVCFGGERMGLTGGFESGSEGKGGTMSDDSPYGLVVRINKGARSEMGDWQAHTVWQGQKWIILSQEGHVDVSEDVTRSVSLSLCLSCSSPHLLRYQYLFHRCPNLFPSGVSTVPGLWGVSCIADTTEHTQPASWVLSSI